MTITDELAVDSAEYHVADIKALDLRKVGNIPRRRRMGGMTKAICDQGGHEGRYGRRYERGVSRKLCAAGASPPVIPRFRGAARVFLRICSYFSMHQEGAGGGGCNHRRSV